MWPKSTEDKIDLYSRAKDAYYNTGNAIMTDSDFDQLEDWLVANVPSFQKTVGAKTGVAEKYKHWSPMLSLDKVQYGTFDNDTDFMLAVNDKIGYYGKYVALPKYDGLALNVQYKNGKLYRALTRGDKSEGRDVKHLLDFLPDRIGYSNDVEIRGEVVLSTSTFNTNPYFQNQQNPRNSASGLLGRDTKITEHNLLEFIVFDIREYLENDVIRHHDFENSKLEFVSNNIHIAHVKEFTNHMDVYNHMLDYRKTSKYQLDGYVLTTFDNDVRNKDTGKTAPKYAVAVKFPAPESITTIEDIEWRLGKTGEFTPVANLTPFELDGSIITKASLHNYGYIFDKKVTIGAKVAIEKAGDIIPQIVKVITSGDGNVNIPTHCSYCNEPLTIDTIHLNCTNPKCLGQLTQKLKSDISILKVDFLGEASIEKLAQSGEYETVLDFLNPTKNSVTALVANGLPNGSQVRKISAQLQSITEIDLANVIKSMGVNNLGDSIANKLAIWWVYDIEDFKGANSKIIKLFTEGHHGIFLDTKLDDLEEWNIDVIVPKDPNETVVVKNNNSIRIINIEMTGSPKPKWNTKQQFVEDCVMNGVNLRPVKINNADYLLTDDVNSNTAKMKTAKSKGIPILTYESFFRKMRYLNN